jgi:hypothetical protein
MLLQSFIPIIEHFLNPDRSPKIEVTNINCVPHFDFIIISSTGQGILILIV